MTAPIIPGKLDPSAKKPARAPGDPAGITGDQVPAANAAAVSSIPASEAATRMRPAGELGGFTVQDWEQPDVKPRGSVVAPTRPASQAESNVASADAPSPAVDPIYLRPGPGVSLTPAPPAGSLPGPGRGATHVDSNAQSVALETETLADAITRRVLASLTKSLHASVAAAIRSLAPEMAISLPAPAAAVVEDAEPTVAAPAQPSRKAPQ